MDVITFSDEYSSGFIILPTDKARRNFNKEIKNASKQIRDLL